MTRLLLSTALAGLLAAGSAAFAQDHHDDHAGHDGGAAPHPQAPHPQPHAPAMHGPEPHAPAGHDDHHMAGPPAGTANHDDHRPADDHRMAGPNPGADHRMSGPPNAMAGHAAPHGNFSALHRAFNAPRHFQAPAYRRPPGWYAHRWTYGEILPRFFWTRDYWLTDFNDYGLMPPPPGTVWVRDGADALLIDQYSGEVIQVEYGVFY